MESSPYTRLVELCERLVAATTQREVAWTAEEETSFVCKRRAGSVGIRSRDRDGEPPYELVVYGPNGAKVENLFSEWTPDEEPAFWNPALAELYRAARRNALGVDRILDDLFAELPATASLETRTPA
ncbi:MAG TPA: hypothetical protein VHF23_10810 [Gaiellaceae bacterium]|nr:hypothetical protein [Gaiellaceae bacterium]